MRRIFDTKNKYLTKKILHKKLLISFIVIFLLLELLFLTFTATSSPLLISLDTKSETTDSVSNLFVDDKPTYSDSDSFVVDDTNTDSDSNSYVWDDITTNSVSDLFVGDDKPTDSSSNSLVENNNFYYAPNERIVPTEEIESITENKLGDLNSGEEKVVKVGYFEDIDNVKFTPKTNLKEVKVTVIKLKDKPEDIIDPPKKNISVYKYLDMKLIANDTYVEEDDIKSLEFKFKVEKAWININKIDKATIKLIRYHDSEWQNLSTTLNSENETYIYYTAESPGFSTFAVVGSKVIEKSESNATEDMSIPWLIIFAFIISLIIMLVVILFKARYFYLKDDSN